MASPAHTPRSLLVCALSAFVAVASLAVLSLATRMPFLVPSLGASIFLMVAAPASPLASPRNALISHITGAAVGLACFDAMGLGEIQATLISGGGVEHVLATSMALAITSVVMLLWGTSHPPAGATTVIAALGFMPRWWMVPMIAVAVIVLTLQVRLCQRLCGCRVGWWNAEREPTPESLTGLRDAA